MFLIVGSLLGCEPGSVVPVPNELIGYWETSVEPYHDRYLMLTPAEVRFGTSPTTSTSHQILEVRDMGEPHQEVYRITYLSDDNEYWLLVRYEPENRTLRLVNQPQMAWERTASFN